MNEEINKQKISSDTLPKNENEEDTYYEKFEDLDKDLKLNKENIVEALRGVYDPEIPVNIYDLGLVYNIDITKDLEVKVEMTLTSPNCPVAGEMPSLVANAIKKLGGFSGVRVNLVWDPIWNKEMMSEDAKLALDIS